MTRSVSSALGFLKMHGLGNDFVVLDARRRPLVLDSRQAVWLADRHVGIGCDQIILLEASDDPECAAFVRFLNADGSEAGACGNGSRCAARLLMEETGSSVVTLQTASGMLHAWRNDVGLIAVDMGEPGLGWNDVPLAHEIDTLAVDVDLGVEGMWQATCCSMGNPHATFFVKEIDAAAVERLGPLVETHALFPARVNAGFAQVMNSRCMRLAVWERGAGRTLACGTGACAAVVAAVRLGLCTGHVRVDLPLGRLTIEWLPSNNHVTMAGPAAISFGGTVELPA